MYTSSIYNVLAGRDLATHGGILRGQNAVNDLYQFLLTKKDQLSSIRITIIIVFYFKFKECHVYICDFHREQAWVRWFKTSRHGISKEDSVSVLSILRKIVHARDDSEYQKLKTQLSEMSVWKGNIQLQRWLDNTWFSEYKTK